MTKSQRRMEKMVAAFQNYVVFIHVRGDEMRAKVEQAILGNP
jgi:hypothetical protein